MRIFPSLAFAAVTAAATMVAATASAQVSERVCKEVCGGGTCRQECVETQGRGQPRGPDVIIEDRRDDRRAPGVDITVPAPIPDIRVGPPRN